MPQISSDRFRRLFCQEFNIGFKLPKSDTCATCDELNLKLKDVTDDTREELSQLRELHLRKAQAGQQMIRELTEKAKKEPKKYHVIAVDLQQALPTPKLTVGPAFYKRKLLSYNLGVHSCSDNQGYMMVWDETTAKRGAEEICSCILKYLSVSQIRAEELHIITDNCRGQNKNWTFISMAAALVKGGFFKKIHQHFPLVGHTYLPCDRDFGRIGEFVRYHCPQVYSPQHWVETIRSANRNKPFAARLLSQEDFKSFQTIMVRKHSQVGGRKLEFASATSFVVDKDGSELAVHKVYSDNDPLVERVPLGRAGKPSVGNVFQLPTKYTARVPIPQPKVNDVLSLFRWIPEEYRVFYNSIVSSGSTPRTGVTLLDESDNEEEDL